MEHNYELHDIIIKMSENITKSLTKIENLENNLEELKEDIKAERFIVNQKIETLLLFKNFTTAVTSTLGIIIGFTSGFFQGAFNWLINK